MPKIVEFEKEPTLDEMQKAVGGFIEVVPFFDFFNGRRCAAICDEEGKLKGLPVNEEATMAWRAQINTSDVLVGDIAIIYGGIS